MAKKIQKQTIEQAYEQLFPLIHQLVKQRKRQTSVLNGSCYIDDDDLVCEGVLALIKSHERFDPNRGFKLITFAYRHIDGAIRDALERAENHAKRVTMMETTEDLDAVAIPSLTEEALVLKARIAQMMEAVESDLPDEQALILVRHYFEGLSLVAIARELEVPLTHVEYLHNFALQRLKETITRV